MFRENSFGILVIWYTDTSGLNNYNEEDVFDDVCLRLYIIVCLFMLFMLLTYLKQQRYTTINECIYQY